MVTMVVATVAYLTTKTKRLLSAASAVTLALVAATAAGFWKGWNG